MSKPACVPTAIAVGSVIGVVLGAADLTYPYSPETHGEISTKAVDRSNLDLVLKTQLDVADGVTSLANGEIVRDWVGIGAHREDEPPVRAVNHFHNPLKLWRDAGGPLGQSSVYWQQNEDQGLGGTWSWPVARERLFDFLTLPGPAARARALADTARALGQVMHMVQDAASPAHTREDPHLFRDGYEARIEELRVEPRRRPPVPLPGVPGFAVDPAANLDLHVDRRSTGAGLGRETDRQRPVRVGPCRRMRSGADWPGRVHERRLRERRHDLLGVRASAPREPGPRGFDPPADTPGARRYFPKTTDGDTVAHFVAEGALYERLLFRGQLVGGFVLDDKVYEDYAAHLIPRAVGYSAALLNYFFRSNFDFKIDVSSNDPSRRLLTISIPPEFSAESMDGTFTLYAEDMAGLRSPVPGGSITTALSRGGVVQTGFAPSFGVRAYVLAFRGRLGSEQGAVTGRVRPMGPLVSAVQTTAEFTGEEQRTTVTETDNASTLVVVERRSKDERQQRAKGTFFSATTSAPDQHLKRVSLEFDARVVGMSAARLLLDDVDVGVAWTRGASVVERPSRWEIRIDLPAFFGGAGGGLVPNVPRFLAVETIEGITIKTPLVWWRSASSFTEGRGARQSVSTCPPELQCEEVVSTSTVMRGLVFFGDGNGEGRDATPSGQRPPVTAAHTSVGFVPVGVVAGYGVGTVEQIGSLNCFGGCTAAASCSTSTIGVFAQSTGGGPVWIKEEFSVSFANLVGVRRPATACTRPVAGQTSAPDLPELRFRRDYLPAEQSLFQELGVTPPEHEITLR